MWLPASMCAKPFRAKGLVKQPPQASPQAPVGRLICARAEGVMRVRRARFRARLADKKSPGLMAGAAWLQCATRSFHQLSRSDIIPTMKPRMAETRPVAKALAMALV